MSKIGVPWNDTPSGAGNRVFGNWGLFHSQGTTWFKNAAQVTSEDQSNIMKPTFAFQIIIDSPPENGPGLESPHPIASDGTVSASGHVGSGVPGLSTVTAQVNSGPAVTEAADLAATAWFFQGALRSPR